MRLSLPFIAAWAIPGIMANFDLYRVEFTYIDQASKVYWQAFEAEGNCETSVITASFEERDDTSGDKIGVRCDGHGCKQFAPIREITQLEMHFTNDPLYHYTIYEDRGYEMYGLDGNTYGHCIPFPHGDFNCDIVGGPYAQASRKFRCLTSLTADQINDAFWDL